MSKKKFKNRSISEAQKAQSAVGRDSYTPVAVAGSATTAFLKKNFELPIDLIKKDLIKNLIFAVGSIVLLATLQRTHFGFAQISSIFHR